MDLFFTLPNEILYKIFSNFLTSDLINLANVSMTAKALFNKIIGLDNFVLSFETDIYIKLYGNEPTGKNIRTRILPLIINTKNISFKYVHLYDEDLKFFKNAESIQFSDCQFVGLGFKYLKKLKHIKLIHCKHVKDKYMKYLGNCETVYLDFCYRITDIGLLALSTNVKKIFVNDYIPSKLFPSKCKKNNDMIKFSRIIKYFNQDEQKITFGDPYECCDGYCFCGYSVYEAICQHLSKKKYGYCYECEDRYGCDMMDVYKLICLQNRYILCDCGFHYVGDGDPIYLNIIYYGNNYREDFKYGSHYSIGNGNYYGSDYENDYHNINGRRSTHCSDNEYDPKECNSINFLHSLNSDNNYRSDYEYESVYSIGDGNYYGSDYEYDP
jgi:hypothetical protein